MELVIPPSSNVGWLEVSPPDGVEANGVGLLRVLFSERLVDPSMVVVATTLPPSHTSSQAVIGLGVPPEHIFRKPNFPREFYDLIFRLANEAEKYPW